MGSKRVKSASSIEKGERGIATLTKLDGNRARIDFVDTGNSFNISVDQGGERPTLPAHVPFAAMKVNGAIQVSATMAKDEPTVLFCNPASGEFKVKFLQFNSPENTPPAPETRQGKKPGSTYRTFSMLSEVVDGRWKGAKLWSQLYANFGNSDGDLAVSGAGTGSDNLQDFLDASCGSEWTTLKYSENPLPAIQKLAQDMVKVYSVVVVKGWVDKYIPDMPDAFGDDDPETPFPDPAPAEKVHAALEEA